MSNYLTAKNLIDLALQASTHEMALSYLDQATKAAENLPAIEKVNVVLQLCSLYYNTFLDSNKSLTLITSIIELHPNDTELLRGKAAILRGMGNPLAAIEILTQLIQLNKYDISAITTIANIYCYSLGDKQKALQYYEMGYSINSTDLILLQSYFCFLAATEEGNDMTKAHALAQEILSIAPSVKEVAEVLQASALKTLDYDMYEKLNINNNFFDHWVNQLNISPLLFQLARVENLEDMLNLVKFHLAFGERMENLARINPITHKPKPLRSKIRIGILSSDLRNHPVGFFTWPLINNFDRSSFEVYCYSNYPYAADHVQEKISHRADHFQLFNGGNSHSIAQSIADDHLDILLEVGGPTSYGRSDICTYRAAPVQISWLGYPHSIGFPTTIDHIIVDRYIKPDNTELLIEKPCIMPHTWVNIDKTIFPTTPIAPSIPEIRNGYITLGTLNATYKLTPKTFEIWAEIMHMIPNSKFLYVRPQAASQTLRDNFRSHMKKHSIAPDRISFAATMRNYLDYYNHIDIALDTFPHTGGTTTCESLWMGVPVVTLVGPSFSKE